MDPKDFIKIAHKHFVFRDDWQTIESSYLQNEYLPCAWLNLARLKKTLSSFKDTLDRARALALTNRPILIEGPQGSERQQFARAIVEFVGGDASRLIPIDCRDNEKASILVANAERSDSERMLFLDYFNDASDNLQKKAAAIMEAPSASIPRVILAISGALDVKRTTWDMHTKSVVKVGTVRPDISHMLSPSTITLPSVWARPWDIPPIIVDCLRQSKVRYLTYNILHLLVWYPWSMDVEEIRSVLEAATTAIADEYCLRFRIIKQFMPKDTMYPPEKSGSQDLGFLETGANCHRRFLSHEWVKDSDLPRAQEMAGKAAQFNEAEEILVDVEKMRECFRYLLPAARTVREFSYESRPGESKAQIAVVAYPEVPGTSVSMLSIVFVTPDIIECQIKGGKRKQYNFWEAGFASQKGNPKGGRRSPNALWGFFHKLAQLEGKVAYSKNFMDAVAVSRMPKDEERGFDDEDSPAFNVAELGSGHAYLQSFKIIGFEQMVNIKNLISDLRAALAKLFPYFPRREFIRHGRIDFAITDGERGKKKSSPIFGDKTTFMLSANPEYSPDEGER